MILINTRLILWLLLSSLFSFFFSFSSAIDTITPTQPLTDGETLVSANGTFALGFFRPNNSINRYLGIWYNNFPSQTVVWVANRQHPITNTTTASLILIANGTLAITINNFTTIWTSFSTTFSNPVHPVAQLLDTGNLVVREENVNNNSEFFAWQSFGYPTDTMLPGMKIGWDLNLGLNRYLTSWKSDDDPSPGDYRLAIDNRGTIPQITLFRGSVRMWRSGIWNGSSFNGIPDLNLYSGFNWEFVNNAEEIYFTYNMANPSIITRMLINQTGVTQRFVWLPQYKIWNLFWYTPVTQCDSFSSCGPYGVCDANANPLCSCLDGFKPKSPANWALRDGTDGCVRNNSLNCVDGTDGFVKISNIFLPDTLNATINTSMSIDHCRAQCLRNCSCTGYASADGSEHGNGCIIWSTELVDISKYLSNGNYFYLRVAAADIVTDTTPTTQKPHKNSGMVIVITVSIVIGVILIACICCCVLRKRKRMRREYRSKEIDNDDEDLELPLYDLRTVISATDNFSNEKQLGQGGFGPVYKGTLGEGQEIAVKRLSKTSMQGIDEFKNEVVLMAKLQHRNLVRLLGCCIRGDERMLIYEYMPNKSLDVFLFDKARKKYLDWQTRYHIIKGIARGLLYLHEDSRLRIIHRDLKASNILLDQEMNPKISDFGMARIFGGDEASSRTRRVVGTYGYMSPEYAMDGIFSVKSDVYSFGVLVLEIVSGQKTKGVFLSESHSYLLGNAWRLWNEGKSLELIDPSISSKFSVTQVMRCIKVGLLCVQERAEDRPTMASVVPLLANQEVSFPEPKQPGFVARRDPSNPSTSSNSVNDLTFTIVDGR